jgi:hypothetical protein
MAESSPNFYHGDIYDEDTLHITRVFDLTYFSRSNFDNVYDVIQLLNYWADLHQIFILHTSNKDTMYMYITYYPGFLFDLLF